MRFAILMTKIKIEGCPEMFFFCLPAKIIVNVLKWLNFRPINANHVVTNKALIIRLLKRNGIPKSGCSRRLHVTWSAHVLIV